MWGGERSYRIGGEYVVNYLCVSKGRWVCMWGEGGGRDKSSCIGGEITVIYIYIYIYIYICVCE